MFSTRTICSAADATTKTFALLFGNLFIPNVYKRQKHDSLVYEYFRLYTNTYVHIYIEKLTCEKAFYHNFLFSSTNLYKGFFFSFFFVSTSIYSVWKDHLPVLEFCLASVLKYSII